MGNLLTNKGEKLTAEDGLACVAMAIVQNLATLREGDHEGGWSKSGGAEEYVSVLV